ncbi:MAG: hypothetical protein V1934_06415 [Methanobacteriota archaeon]
MVDDSESSIDIYKLRSLYEDFEDEELIIYQSVYGRKIYNSFKLYDKTGGGAVQMNGHSQCIADTDKHIGDYYYLLAARWVRVSDSTIHFISEAKWAPRSGPTVPTIGLGLASSFSAGGKYALFKNGATRGTVKCVTKKSWLETSSDNIPCDIGINHKYEIKLRAGHVYFYIDHIEVAHHTTNIPDSTESLQAHAAITTNDNVASAMTLEYIFVILGEKF